MDAHAISRTAAYEATMRGLASVLHDACADPFDAEAVLACADELAGSEPAAVAAVRRWCEADPAQTVSALQREFAWQVTRGMRGLVQVEQRQLLVALVAQAAAEHDH